MFLLQRGVDPYDVLFGRLESTFRNGEEIFHNIIVPGIAEEQRAFLHTAILAMVDCDKSIWDRAYHAFSMQDVVIG